MASKSENPSTNTSSEEQQQRESHESSTISPQEIEPFRAQAQQNSIDAIRAAEDRYAKAKESGTAAFQRSQETVAHGLVAGTNYLAGKGYQAADYTTEKGKKGYEAAAEVAVSAAQKAAELAKQAAVRAKEVTVSAGETALDYAKGKTASGGEGRAEETADTGEAKEAEWGGGESILISGEEGSGGRKVGGMKE